MAFYSMLFRRPFDNEKLEVNPPGCFRDLNLDQIVEAITLGKEAYNLTPFFYTTVEDVETVHFRHEVMRDLENPELMKSVKQFAAKMADARRHVKEAGKLYYKLQQNAVFLEAVSVYCDAVQEFSVQLHQHTIQSQGMLNFRDYLADHTSSQRFTSLNSTTMDLKAELATIQYTLLIKGNSVTVRRYNGEKDYATDVLETFEKFQQGTTTDYRVEFQNSLEMNHVEAQVLERLSWLYSESFNALERFRNDNQDFIDEKIAVFDREIQFYVSYLDFMTILQRHGLKFCYPRMSDVSKEVFADETFDAALAYKLVSNQVPVVCNDFHLSDPERIFVVSGPNQGGKTTFARTFGQIHFLGALGCLVPGQQAQLFLFDQLFSHFEREDSMVSQSGKLQDDLLRIRDILERVTPNSIVILNEIFSSTTLVDARLLAQEVMYRMMRLDLLSVVVTFIDELAVLSETTVSMVSTIVPEDPSVRTYKVLRRPADGLSYALSIATKYRLTYTELKERIRS